MSHFKSNWTNADLSLWLKRDSDKPEYINYAASIREINFTAQDAAEWRCPKCGSMNRATMQCEGCNARKSDLSAQGIATVRIVLPDKYCLANLLPGFCFELCYRECGNPAFYRGESVILRLSDCRILRKWMPIVGYCPPEDDVSELALYLEVGCKAELVWKDQDDD